YEPNIVHNVCARWEKEGLVRAVVTQNIDALHHRAGSRNVIELHGSPFTHSCLDCRASQSYQWACREVREQVVPRCPECGGVVKPDITFFGELLPEGAVEKAMGEADASDVMLVLGTSLAVYPAALVPERAAASGTRLAIVNRGETALDKQAACRYDDLQSVFEALDRLV
ncbi:MAG: SIR2 family NAD-dependent protein deacylase, partial [Candidatus Sumerlaeota bacterium]